MKEIIISGLFALLFVTICFFIFHTIRERGRKEEKKQRERMIEIIKDSYRRGYKDGFYDMQELINKDKTARISYLSVTMLEENVEKFIDDLGIAVPK